MCLSAKLVYVLTCLRASMVYVPTCLRDNVPKVCQFLIFMCQRANKRVIRLASVSIWRANVPNGVPIFQLGVLNFHTFPLQNAKGNFYTLLLYKIFYIILDIIIIHPIGICIIHKSCIVLHFYASYHIKEKCVEILFLFLLLFFSLFRNENIK